MRPGALPGAQIRSLASAFVVATLAALVVDAVMQLTLEAVRVSAAGTSPPWWITANLVSRGRWVVLAGLLWWLAPRLVRPDGSAGDHAAGTLDRSEAWRRVGVSVIALPLLWTLATWVVSAIRFTLLGTWPTDGRVFLAPEYYRSLSVDYVPWLMAGLVVLGVRRHL